MDRTRSSPRSLYIPDLPAKIASLPQARTTQGSSALGLFPVILFLQYEVFHHGSVYGWKEGARGAQPSYSTSHLPMMTMCNALCLPDSVEVHLATDPPHWSSSVDPSWLGGADPAYAYAGRGINSPCWWRDERRAGSSLRSFLGEGLAVQIHKSYFKIGDWVC